MATITMNTLADALKTFYLPAIVDQMNYESNAFYAQIERNSDEVLGSVIKMAMKYGRRGGTGNRSEDGELPTPGARKIKQVEYETKNIFARLRITEKMIRASQKSVGAFVSVLQMEMEDTVADAKDSFGRQLYGDGKGVLAICTAQSGVNTLAISSVQYLAEGMLVDICTSDGTVKEASREITAVDRDNGEITIDGAAVTTLDNDGIVQSGNYGLELTGLNDIFQSTGILYGLDRTDHKFLVPKVSNIGGELSELDMQQGIDEAEIRAGSKIDFLICGHGIRRAFQYLMSSMRRNIETMDLKGGWKAMSYNGIPLVADKYAPGGTLFELAKEDFKIHQMGEWDWLDRDNAMLKQVPNKAAWEASLVKYADLGCRRPAGQVKLHGITEH